MTSGLNRPPTTTTTTEVNMHTQPAPVWWWWWGMFLWVLCQTKQVSGQPVLCSETLYSPSVTLSPHKAVQELLVMWTCSGQSCYSGGWGGVKITWAQELEPSLSKNINSLKNKTKQNLLFHKIYLLKCNLSLNSSERIEKYLCVFSLAVFLMIKLPRAHVLPYLESPGTVLAYCHPAAPFKN